jgi:hypothetical protein
MDCITILCHCFSAGGWGACWVPADTGMLSQSLFAHALVTLSTSCQDVSLCVWHHPVSGHQSSGTCVLQAVDVDVCRNLHAYWSSGNYQSSHMQLLTEGFSCVAVPLA